MTATENLGGEKAYRGMGMDGFVARWYASLTRNSMPEFTLLAARIAAELPAHAEVLEVAPGPGYFAIELAKLGFRVDGLDISPTFIEIASENARKAGVSADFHLGDAAHMPFASNSFDFLLCRAAFKNFARPVTALQEMHRVLKPGGSALIIDLRKDAPEESVSVAVDEMKLGPINALLTKLIFRTTLLKRAYTRKQLEVFCLQTDFQPPEIQEGLMGFELRLHKSWKG